MCSDTLDTAKSSYFRSFLGKINIVDEVGSGAACAITCLCLIYGSSDLPPLDLMLKLLLGFVVAIDIFSPVLRIELGTDHRIANPVPCTTESYTQLQYLIIFLIYNAHVTKANNSLLAIPLFDL